MRLAQSTEFDFAILDVNSTARRSRLLWYSPDQRSQLGFLGGRGFGMDLNKSFMSTHLPARASAILRWRNRQNMKTLAAINDRIRTVKPESEVVPGIAAIATPVHTPGHTSVQIASGSNQLLCTADVVGNRAVAFRHPDWRGGFDLDLDQGAKTRRAFLDRCASEKVTVSSYHLPFPGIGHVVRTGTAFSWLPSDWRWEGVSPT